MKYDLDKVIRKIPDFPKPGILYYDITGIIINPEAFKHCMNQIVETYKEETFHAVAAVESRGFIFAAPLALALGVPLLLVRKQGKLPGKILSRAYSLEYGEGVLEVKPDDVPQGGNVLLLDDLLATGGTLKAAAELLEEAGAIVRDVFCVVGLPYLNSAKKLVGRRVTTLIEYHGE